MKHVSSLKNYVFQLYIKRKLGLAGSYVICLSVFCSLETLPIQTCLKS